MCKSIPGIHTMNLSNQSKFCLDNHFVGLPLLIWQNMAAVCALERYFTELLFLYASQSEFANERGLLKTGKAARMIQVPLFSIIPLCLQPDTWKTFPATSQKALENHPVMWQSMIWELRRDS